MTVGSAATTLANKWLDVLGGTTFTAPTNTFAKLHTGDPGSAGTSNASSVTTRQQLTWSAASAGSKSISTSPSSWSMTGTETISHISVWDASTSGNFLFSVALTASQPVVNGSTLTLTSLTAAMTPIAA